MGSSAHKIPVSKVRGNFSSIVDAVRVDDERIVLTQHGRDVAVIIPVGDLALLEELEDRTDAAEIRRRIARSTGTISLAELRSDLGARKVVPIAGSGKATGKKKTTKTTGKKKVRSQARIRP